MIYLDGKRIPVTMRRFDTHWFEWNRWHNAHPPEWFVSFWEERGLVLVKDGNNFSMRVPK